MDQGSSAFLDVWNNLPQDYVPQWSFAYSENDGGLYAYPASDYTKAQYGSRSGQPFRYNSGDESANPITSQSLATGGVPGAVRIGGQYGNENIDPSMAQDLQIWNRMVQAGNANRDEFQGPVANIFGNAFTIPALFAAGAMGANAAGQLGVGGTAAAPGAAGPAATAGPAASAATPAAGGGGLLSAIGGGLKTGLPLAAAGMGLIGAVGGAAQGRTSPGGESTQTSTSGPGEPDPILTAGRELAQQGIPLQVSNYLDALGKLRARSKGSTAELLPSLQGSLTDLRTQYGDASSALSRKLGYAGGGQVQRGKAQLLSQATKQYAGMIGKGQQTAFGGLINAEGGFQPSLSNAARPPSVSTGTGSSIKTGQVDTSLYGTSAASLMSMADSLRKADERRQAAAFQVPGVGGGSAGFGTTARGVPAFGYENYEEGFG